MSQFNNKGHLLAEAALIMPLIMLVIVAIIYLLLNLYNLTCLQSVANISCERGSYLIGDNIKSNEMSLHEKSFLYSKQVKKGIIQKNIDQGAEAFSLSCKEASVDIVPALGFSKLNINTVGIYQIPSLSNISKAVFNQSHVRSYYIHDEAELIRNIDLVKDSAYAAFKNVFEEASKRSETLENRNE